MSKQVSNEFNITKLYSQLEAEIELSLKWSDNHFHDLNSHLDYIFYNENILFMYFKFMQQILIKA